MTNDCNGFGFSFGFRVPEWDDYKCEAQTKHGGSPIPKVTFDGEDINLFHRVMVKILDLPASEEDKQKRLDVLNRNPKNGPSAVTFLDKQHDGWYLFLPYPNEANQEGLLEETAVLLSWFSRGVGVSVDLA